MAVEKTGKPGSEQLPQKSITVCGGLPESNIPFSFSSRSQTGHRCNLNVKCICGRCYAKVKLFLAYYSIVKHEIELGNTNALSKT